MLPSAQLALVSQSIKQCLFIEKNMNLSFAKSLIFFIFNSCCLLVMKDWCSEQLWWKADEINMKEKMNKFKIDKKNNRKSLLCFFAISKEA